MYTDILLDKPRRLRFDLTAIRSLEAAMGGKPLGHVLDDLGNMGLTALVLALHAGLRHEDAALTNSLTAKILEQHLTDGGTLDVVFAKVKDALDASGLFKTAQDRTAEGNAPPEPAPL